MPDPSRFEQDRFALPRPILHQCRLIYADVHRQPDDIKDPGSGRLQGGSGHLLSFLDGPVLWLQGLWPIHCLRLRPMQRWRAAALHENRRCIHPCRQYGSWQQHDGLDSNMLADRRRTLQHAYAVLAGLSLSDKRFLHFRGGNSNVWQFFQLVLQRTQLHQVCQADSSNGPLQ